MGESDGCFDSALALLSMAKKSPDNPCLRGDDLSAYNLPPSDLPKLRKKLGSLRNAGGKVKINLGANGVSVKNFINVDYNELNMLKPKDWNQLLGGREIGGVDSLFSEHVFEHLTP